MELKSVPTSEESGSAAPGPALGFKSMENEVRIESVPVTGEPPAWLEGSLLRTGPAKFEAGEHRYRHWFDGQAMLHRFGFEDGRVSYASRFLRGKAYEAAADGRIEYSEFATDPCRGLFKRVMSFFDPKLSDNANVNLTRLGERYIAMTETPIPVEFDAETLATAGVAYEVPGMLTTAHPHLDRGTGGMLNYAAKLGPRNEYRFFHLGPESGAEPEIVASAPDPEARLHALVRAQRALADPGRVPVRGRSEAAGPVGAAVHRELPLGARARAPGSRSSTAGRHGARAVRDRPDVLLPPPERVRARRFDRRRPAGLPRRVAGRAALPRPPPRPGRPRDRRPDDRAARDHPRRRLRARDRARDAVRSRLRARADQLRPLQRASLPVRLGPGDRGQRLARDDRPRRPRDARAALLE